MKILLAVLYYASILSAWVAVATGLRVRGFLWYYVLVSGICDLIPVTKPFPENPHWYGNIFFAAQFVLVCGYFIQQLLPPRQQRGAAAVVFAITAFFLFFVSKSGFWKVHYQAGAVLYGLLILPTLGGFYSIIRREELLRLERSPFFLFCAAFLLYVAGSCLILLFAPRFRTENYRFLVLIWGAVHNTLNILKNLAIARALYLYRLPEKTDDRY